MIRGWQPKSMAEELSKCCRFYEKTYDIDTAPGTITHNGAFDTQAGPAVGSAQAFIAWHFKSHKRADPTVTHYSPVTGASAKAADITGAADVATGTGLPGQAGTILLTGVALTDGNTIQFHATAEAGL